MEAQLFQFLQTLQILQNIFKYVFRLNVQAGDGLFPKRERIHLCYSILELAILKF